MAQTIYFIIYIVFGMLLCACYNFVAKHTKRLINAEYEYEKTEEQNKIASGLLFGSWVLFLIFMTTLINIGTFFDNKDKELEQRIETLEKSICEPNQENTITFEEVTNITKV